MGHVTAQQFKEDLNKQNIGINPENWKVVSGMANIAEVGGERVIQLKQEGLIHPTLDIPDYLGDDFTIEFDLLFDEQPNTSRNQSYKLRLWPGKKAGKLLTADGTKTFRAITIKRHGVDTETKGKGPGHNGQFGHYNKEMRETESVWRHVELTYKENRLQFFLDGTKFIDMQNYEFDPSMLSIQAHSNAGKADIIHALKNVTFNYEAGTSEEIVDQKIFNRNIDKEAHQKLHELKPQGIQSFSFSQNGGWVIITKNNKHFARNIPDECYQKIKSFITSGHQIKEVVFPPMGGKNSWIIITDRTTFSRNIPQSCHDQIKAFEASGEKIKSVAFPYKNIYENTKNSWIIITESGKTFAKQIPDECYQIIQNLKQSDMPGKPAARKIHRVSFAPDGGWFVMAEDYFFARNIPNEAFDKVKEFRSDNYAAVNLAFDEDGSGWSLVSQKITEEVPQDLIRQFEKNVIGGRSMWQTMRDTSVVGISIGVVINGKLAWTTSYGHLQNGNKKTAAHPDSFFQLASISKVVAAAGGHKLVDKNLITLTEDLRASGKLEFTVPFNGCIEDEDWTDTFNSITLENILQHKSGIEGRGSKFLPTCAYDSINVGGGYGGTEGTAPSLDELLESITITYDPDVVPKPNGRSSWYSGPAFTVLQKLTEDVTNESYAEWMQDEILDPCNMEKSRFIVDPSNLYKSSNLARAHDTISQIYPQQKYPQFAAAGLYSNVEEFSNFMIMLNNRGVYSGNQVLSENAIVNLIDNDIGINKSTSRNGNTFFGHGGTNKGMRVLFRIYPNITSDDSGEDKYQSAGIIVLINTAVHPSFRSGVIGAIETVYGW